MGIYVSTGCIHFHSHQCGHQVNPFLPQAGCGYSFPRSTVWMLGLSLFTVNSVDVRMFSFPLPCGRIYRPSFRENKHKRFGLVFAETLVFRHRIRAFWACFRENWVYKSATAGDRCEGRFPFDTRQCKRKGLSLSTVKSVDLMVYPCLQSTVQTLGCTLSTTSRVGT
jgi:hypothetical protein